MRGMGGKGWQQRLKGVLLLLLLLLLLLWCHCSSGSGAVKEQGGCGAPRRSASASSPGL